MRPLLDATKRPRLVRGLTVGLGAATVVIGSWLLLRGSPEPPTAEPDLPQGTAPVDLPKETAPESTPASTLPGDCDALAARAGEGGPDAALMAWLCPDVPLDAVTARAALLAVRTPEEAAALAPRLVDQPALEGLARLVAQDEIRPTVAAVPDPTQAVVSPVDVRVLAQVQRAHTVIAMPGVGPTERTRARAFVAKAYLQATQQLGIGVGRPPPPFARLLIGRALHYGRLFCVSYWRLRVRGLSGLFAEVETQLLALVLSVETNAYHGDAARLAVELDQTRQYLKREGPRARIERRLGERAGAGWGPERLQPMPNALDRLIEHGFVDLALARGLAEARRSDGPGLRPMEQLLTDALSRTERGEYGRLLERRVEQARGRQSPPSERGPGGIEHAAELSWPPADAVADEATTWIERAPPADTPGLARAYALGRALLLVRPRPDALVVLLDRSTDPSASAELNAATPWLAEELGARDDGRLPWLARRVAAEAELEARPARSPKMRHAGEAARRRRFALAVRDDGRLPRGAGL